MTFAPRVEFQVSEADLARVRFQLAGIKNGVPRAITRALNNTASKSKTEAIAEARKDVRLTATYLRERIRGPNDSAANKATFTRQIAKVTAQTRGTRMFTFGTNVGTDANPGGTVGFGWPSNPPRTKIKPTGTSTQWKGAFLLMLKNANVPGIFIRTGAGIEHVYGPSPSQIFASEKDVIAPRMSEYLAEQLLAETKAVLRQYG